MLSAAESVSQGRDTPITLCQFVVIQGEGTQAEEIVDTLRSEGFERIKIQTATAAAETTSLERTDLIILPDPSKFRSLTELLREANEREIPTLAVLTDCADPTTMSDALVDVTDWMTASTLRSQLSLRVARLLKRAGQSRSCAQSLGKGPGNAGSQFSMDSDFFALVVHDLRTPLNVIGLSLRMISQALPPNDPNLEEDLRFLEENFKQIERMLLQLSEYYRLFETASQTNSVEFNPSRLVEELLEARVAKAGAKTVPVVVEEDSTCPTEVSLDPLKAQMAIHYALANATAAANGNPIRLRMRGGPDRWVIEVSNDQPAPSSVKSVSLKPGSFERLCGCAAERRGMDLAIAAKVSEAFGGTANLEVIDRKGTVIVLDWPARLNNS
ncbi:MAG: hypothetical protein NVSMB9_07000 [Isosphaeraceae bacterium]